jgi:hypothetical protein
MTVLIAVELTEDIPGKRPDDSTHWLVRMRKQSGKREMVKHDARRVVHPKLVIIVALHRTDRQSRHQIPHIVVGINTRSESLRYFCAQRAYRFGIGRPRREGWKAEIRPIK